MHRGPLRRRRRDDDDEGRNWRERRGRFEGLDRDTDDRVQVMPVPEPAAERQTHNRLADLTRPDTDDEAPEPITGHGGIVAKKPVVGDDDGA